MHDAWVPLLLSLKVAGWATALDLVLGVAAGYALARWRSGARDVVDSLLTLPLVLPPTVLGYYLLVLLGRRGVLGAWLDRIGIQLVFTWQGAVIASMVVAFPLILKSARAAFEAVDPQLERAARTLDALAAQSELSEDDVARASVAVGEAKVLTTEIALLASEKLFELAGTQATLAEHGLDRHWRNARTHTLHDPVRWKYIAIGDYAVNDTLPPRHGAL